MSLRLWLETISVFSRASVLISSSMLRRASGSSPCVGSSQMSRSGSLMRLAATASRAVMPLEKPAMRIAGDAQQIDGADQRGEARLAHVLGQPEQAGHVVEIGDRRHAARELRIGGDVADAAAQVGGVGRHEFAEHLGPAGGRAMQADDEAQQRRLAGAVGAEQTQDAAGFEPQRHVIQGNLAVLVNLGELEGFDHQIAGVLGHAISSSIRTTRGRSIRASGSACIDQLPVRRGFLLQPG